MSNSDSDQPTASDDSTVCLRTNGNLITIQFPPAQSIPVNSSRFSIGSIDIPLSAYQLSADFHNFPATTTTPSLIFLSDAVKIMEQQQFRIPFNRLFAMPLSDDGENLPGTSGASSSSTQRHLDVSTTSTDGCDQQGEGQRQEQNPQEPEAPTEDVLTSQTKKQEKLINRVAPIPNLCPPSPEPEARLERPLPRARQEASPRIRVLHVRSEDFATLPIKFAVEVMDFPKDLAVSSTMIDAIVRSASGNPITCVIGSDYETFKKGRVNVFKGFFEATEETGAYKLQVRLVLPMTVYRSDYGVMGDEANILVMKNYERDGLQFTGPVFQLPFEQQSRQLPLQHGLATTGGRTVLKAWGLACDKPTNRLYYTDCMGNKVNCVDPRNGRVLFEFQGHSSFNHPMGIDVDEPNRRVLVCDKDNHRICIFTVGGHFISAVGKFGYDDGMFNYPWDVAVNPSGNRFAVTDTENKRVQLFDLLGNFVNSFSVFVSNPFVARNQFDCPRAIVFGNQGKHVFVTDFNTKNVVQIPMHLRTYRRVAPECEFLQPQGLVFDEFNTLLVADSQHNCICQTTLCGKLLSRIRRVGENNLQNPVNMTLMAGGSLAVLDARGKLYII